MAVQMKAGKYPHIFWVDLRGNNIFEECAIMKRHPNGDMTYIPLSGLDSIDQSRLLKVVRDRSAHIMELWELMKHHRLGNGVNALIYFDQLAKTITTDGRVIRGKGQQYGGGENRAIRSGAPAKQPSAQLNEAVSEEAPKKRGRKPKVQPDAEE